MIKTNLDKTVKKKLNAIDKKIKTSFLLIRQDVDEIQNTVNAMSDYLKKKDKEYVEKKDVDEKIQEEFRRDVDEFTQKIMQLKIALSEVKAIQKEVVIRKDLAKIEERIKTSFKSDIEKYKEQVNKLRLYLNEAEKRIDCLEKNKPYKKKRVFQIFKKDNEN